MTASVRAWLLQPGTPFSLALSEHEQVEVLSAPNCFPVPLSPGYCAEVIQWREQLIPLLRLRPMVEHVREDWQPRYVSVCAYQERSGMPLEHAAIALTEPPRAIEVWDYMAGDLSELPVELSPMLLACIHHGDWPVAILDLARLFSANPSSPPSPPPVPDESPDSTWVGGEG